MTIDVNQMPMRLVNQSKGTSRAKGPHQRNMINGMIQTQQANAGAKNAWQSVDASRNMEDMNTVAHN